MSSKKNPKMDATPNVAAARKAGTQKATTHNVVKRVQPLVKHVASTPNVDRANKANGAARKAADAKRNLVRETVSSQDALPNKVRPTSHGDVVTPSQEDQGGELSDPEVLSTRSSSAQSNNNVVVDQDGTVLADYSESEDTPDHQEGSPEESVAATAVISQEKGQKPNKDSREQQSGAVRSVPGSTVPAVKDKKRSQDGLRPSPTGVNPVPSIEVKPAAGTQSKTTESKLSSRREPSAPNKSEIVSEPGLRARTPVSAAQTLPERKVQASSSHNPFSVAAVLDRVNTETKQEARQQFERDISALNLVAKESKHLLDTGIAPYSNVHSPYEVLRFLDRIRTFCNQRYCGRPAGMVTKAVLQVALGLFLNQPHWQEQIRSRVLEPCLQTNTWPDSATICRSILESLFSPVLCTLDLTSRLDNIRQRPGQTLEDYIQDASSLWQIIRVTQTVASEHAGQRFVMGLLSRQLRERIDQVAVWMQLTTVVNDFPATSLVPPVMQSLTFERAVVFARTIQQRMDQDALREQQEESIMPFVAAAGNQSTKRQHAEVEYSITGVHDTPVQRFPDKYKKQKSSSNEKRKQPGAPNGSSPKQCLMHRQSITHSTDECTTLIRMREQLSQAPHAARFSEKPCKGCGAVEHAFKDCFLARVPNNSSNEAGPGKLPESVKDLSSITGSLIAPFLTAVGCLIQQAKGPVISSSSGPLIVEPRIHSIDGQRVRCFIDTGCTNMSFITKRLCSELNLKIHQDINVTQILADNTARQALGVTDEFCLYYNNKARTLRAVVVEEMLFTDLTLGCDDSVQLGIVTITTENPLQGTDPGFLTELEHLHDTSMKMLEEEADADAGAKVEAAIHDLMEINQKVKGFAEVPPIKLNLSTDEPIYIPQYPISNKEDVKLQITKWLATGKIRICQPGETRNNLPLTTAGKFDNQGRRVGTRICLDPRAVNKITAKSDYPIPTVRNVIDSLVGNKYFTELDLEDAFLQIRLSEEDQKTLVFTFEGVTYAFIGSPYGLHFMTSEFQLSLIHI